MYIKRFMGFFGNLWSGIKKVGSSIASGVKKVGQVISSPETWRKIGDVAGKVVDVAKKVAPFVQNIPVVGQVVGAISKGGELVDLAKRAGSGDIKGALLGAGKMASSFVPGGQYIRRGIDAYERFSP